MNNFFHMPVDRCCERGSAPVPTRPSCESRVRRQFGSDFSGSYGVLAVPACGRHRFGDHRQPWRFGSANRRLSGRSNPGSRENRRFLFPNWQKHSRSQAPSPCRPSTGSCTHGCRFRQRALKRNRRRHACPSGARKGREKPRQPCRSALRPPAGIAHRGSAFRLHRS